MRHASAPQRPGAPKPVRIAAIVLAAGTSSRMGRPKALVPIGGRPMLERVLAHLKRAPIDGAVVVLGSHADEIRHALDLGSARVVENPGFAEGLGSSLRVGVAAAPPASTHLLIVLGDQPFVSPEAVRELVRAAGSGDGEIYIPTYKGVRGNPVLFSARLAPEAAHIQGDVGCRAMFPRHVRAIREVPVDDPGILVDIDSEEELKAVERATASGGSLSAALDRLTAPRWSLHATPREHPEPKRLGRSPDIPALAHELRARHVPFALATVVRVVRPTSGRPGYQAIIREDGSHVGWVGGACTEDLLVAEARAAMKAGLPRLLRVTPAAGLEIPAEGVVERAMTCQSGGTVEIFIEPNLPKPNLVIVGDSPVATSLATLAPVLGFRTVLVAPGGDREEMPEVDEFVPRLEEIGSHLGPTTYAIVASMGKYDESALAPIARGPVAFAGLVASRKRAASVFAALREDGITETEIATVRNPVGLDIAASTPEEIALSILAELVRVRRTAAAPPAGSSPAPSAARAGTAIDPVCRMEVETSTPLHATHAGTTYYFCSDGCRRKFSRSPAKFLST